MLTNDEKRLWHAVTKLLCQLMAKQNQMHRQLLILEAALQDHLDTQRKGLTFKQRLIGVRYGIEKALANKTVPEDQELAALDQALAAIERDKLTLEN